jgi:16S rRNA (uracil1498-N3)-methyltransferase
MTSVPVFHAPSGRIAAATPSLRLDGPEGRHAALVRRLQVGERLDVTDGAGLLAECVVARRDGQELDLDILSVHAVPRPWPRITVVQALAKGDRGETAVETMTEIGVDAVVPWSAGRSITRWQGERGAKALAKWRSTAAEAAKQARRPWWPEVAELASTAAVAKMLAVAAVPVVLHESASVALAGIELELPGSSAAAAAADATPDGDIILVVGPEGGISPEELELFIASGATAYRMGPTVLRTSTAGTAAAAVLLARSGRWA